MEMRNMRVDTLDHVNIVTDDLPGTARFYAEVFGLDVRDGPAPSRPDKVQWAYDDQGRAILHLNATGAFQVFKRDVTPGETTGAVHHVALKCAGHAEMVARLEARGLAHSFNDVPSIGLRQIFVVDPNGVLLELNFPGD
jgi:catechol 2,3-dioxygenase-like lactoylglutathione lyase family enzyme